MYAVLRHQKKFEALRSFTLENGQAEIERRNRRHKGDPNESTDSFDIDSRISSDSPSTSHQLSPTLGGVPEEAFAIGDDEDEDADSDHRSTREHSTPTDRPSQPSSVSSSALNDTMPIQYVSITQYKFLLW